MTKKELRRLYRLWANEEIEFIELIEAVGKYLGEDGLRDTSGRDYDTRQSGDNSWQP